MSMDATKEQFEHVELFGKPALFTNSRMDVSTVPLGFYCYNLRGSDNDPGRPVTLELYVGVNHVGTVLTPEPVKIPKSGYNGGRRVSGELVRGAPAGTGAAGSLWGTVCQMALWRSADPAGRMEIRSAEG